MSTPTGWNYDLMGTSEDKKASKLAVRPPYAYELRNVDGTTEGPCRPFPGFKEIYRFGNPSSKVYGTGGYHNSSSEIVEFFPFQITVGSNHYAYGFVYRMRRSGAATGSEACDIFVDLWRSNGGPSYTGAWEQRIVLKEGVPLPPWMAVDGRPMSVVAYDRFLYVFVEGVSATSLYYLQDETNEDLYTATITSPIGPKQRPTLVGPAKAEPLGSTDPPATDRAAVAQVVLLAYSPEETGLMSGIYPSGSDSGTGIPPGRQTLDDIEYLEPGDYAFAVQLFDTRSGRYSALSEIAQARAIDFDPDTSGPLTATSLFAAVEISFNSDVYDQAYIYRSVKVQDAGGTYVAGILHLDKIIDLSDYLTVNADSASFIGPNDQAIYYYELEDKQLVYQETFNDLVLFDEEVPRGGAAIWYEGVLIVGAIRDNPISTTDEHRRNDVTLSISDIRYSSLLYKSAELFPPGNRYVPSQSATPVLTFVQAGPNVIGFSRDKQFHFRKSGTYLKPEEMHDGFGVTGPHAVDVVGSAAYFMTTKGLKTVDAMGQLEDIKAFNELILEVWSGDLAGVSIAYDPGVSALFILNPTRYEGCVLWFNSAMSSELSDLYFRQVARGAWPSAVSGYAWNTFRIDPNDTDITGWDSPLAQRAFFLEKAPRESESASVLGANWGQRVFVVDFNREKMQNLGSRSTEARFSMLPFEGDSIFKVHSDYNASSATDYMQVRTAAVVLGTTYYEDGNHELDQSIWGCKLYVLWSSNTSMIGRSAWITHRPGTALDYSYIAFGENRSNLVGVKAGDIVGISPVPFRWIGHPLSAAEQTPQDPSPANTFQLRHAQAISCLFSDVQGIHLESEHSTEARFTGLLYRNSSPTPTAIGYTRDNNNDRTRSIHDDETPDIAGMAEGDGRGRHGFSSLLMTPGIQILCPDIDYRLVSVKVTGTQIDSSSSQRRS